MRKIKICVQMPTHWSAMMGGAEYQVSLIMQQLITDDRFDVVFLTRKVDASLTPVDYRVKKFNIIPYLSGYSNAFDAKNLLSALEEIQPDIIYQRVGCAHTGVCAWYARRKNIPMVWHISHDMDVDPKVNFKKHVFGWLEKRFIEYGIQHTTKIIAQTDRQGMLLEKYYGRKPDYVIRNFHPTPESTTNKKEEKIKIVWIANFKPMKQPEVFVRLAKELENEIDAQFIMIGKANNAEYNKLLEEKIKSLDYLGVLPQQEVNELLSTAHLLVNTSKLEGFSNTFIQAWMREVPVLTLNVDPDDVIKKNEIGVCCHGDYAKLKATIIDFVKSPEQRAKMGEKGKRYAYENHSMKNVDQLIKILASLPTNEQPC